MLDSLIDFAAHHPARTAGSASVIIHAADSSLILVLFYPHVIMPFHNEKSRSERSGIFKTCLAII